MRESKSDIFEEYSRIAEETGLVSKAEDSPDIKKYKDTLYPRMDSLDISAIEALYGVKPDSSIEYERNIFEAAHPHPVVIGPAYDRINALFENENEGQDIRINISCGPTTAKNITQGPKLARKELLMELVRIANALDNANEPVLRAAADECITKLYQEAAILSKKKSQ